MCGLFCSIAPSITTGHHVHSSQTQLKKDRTICSIFPLAWEQGAKISRPTPQASFPVSFAARKPCHVLHPARGSPQLRPCGGNNCSIRPLGSTALSVKFVTPVAYLIPFCILENVTAASLSVLNAISLLAVGQHWLGYSQSLYCPYRDIRRSHSQNVHSSKHQSSNSTSWFTNCFPHIL